MKKLGKKNLEVLNTVEAYATQEDYDKCTYEGIIHCGDFVNRINHIIDNNSSWEINFRGFYYGEF